MKNHRKPRSTHLMVAVAVAFFGCLSISPAMADTKSSQAISTADNARAVRSKSYSFRIDQTPAWIAPIREEIKERPKNAALFLAYVDEQIKVGKGDTEFYRHAVKVVSEPAGLGPAAQVLAEFDPAYQDLTFHRLGIWRGNKYIDKLNKKRISLLQRETQLEYRIYDGRVTASSLLDDVRVGDRVEYSYTIRGSNPVFDGRFVHTSWMVSEAGPVIHYRLRLLAAPERHINHRSGPDVVVTENEKGGLREITFSRHDVPQFSYDRAAPDSVYLADQVQLSEFADWSEVAKWGARLFADAVATPAATVHQRAEAIRNSSQDPEDRMRQALDFVQNEVRYFGLEMGVNSHHPAPPAKVIEQRFGDCKDKASLLVGLLRDLGIAAEPVLVSVHLGGKAEEALPGPLAFDHAIVRAELNGKTYWLDGTRSLQTGGLPDRQATGFEKGLVLNAASANLSDLPGWDGEERISVEETFHVTQFSGDPVLESKITYFGILAEYLRQTASTTPLQELETDFSEDYARLYPGVTRMESLKLVEVSGRNAVTVAQRFAVPGFWSFPDSRYLAGEVGLWGITQAVRHPDETLRHNPLKVQLPGIHRHAVVMEYPEDISLTSSSTRFDDGDRNFAYSVTYDSYPRGAKVNATMKIVKDAVSVADWHSYTEKLHKLRTRFVASVSVPTIRLDHMEKLKKDLNGIDQQRRAGKLKDKVKTQAQFSAMARTISLTAQLDDGRLPPLLRAQALRERGIQLDHQGLAEAAAADFKESIRLNPADPQNYVDAAANAFSMGDDALATQYLNKAIDLAPSEHSTHDVKVFTSYFSGNYAAARESLLKSLSNPAEAERSYPVIWLYLSSRRLGENGTDATRRYLPVSTKPAWPYPLLQYFVGAGTFDQALTAAKEIAPDPSRLCELYYYAGEKALTDGDKRAAQEYFRKTIDTGVVEFNEYVMAKRRLDSPEIW